MNCTNFGNHVYLVCPDQICSSTSSKNLCHASLEYTVHFLNKLQVYGAICSMKSTDKLKNGCMHLNIYIFKWDCTIDLNQSHRVGH